jgi:hypothetical protein
VEESQSTERPFPRIGQELRLDNRYTIKHNDSFLFYSVSAEHVL